MNETTNAHKDTVHKLNEEIEHLKDENEHLKDGMTGDQDHVSDLHVELYLERSSSDVVTNLLDKRLKDKLEKAAAAH